MAAETTDAQLVRRVQKGDKGAFDLLVLKYQHKIVNLVMRYVRDPDQALDITQEAFLKAYRALPRFRGDAAFYTWMYRIAVNTAKNYLAAQRRRPMDVELDLQDPEQYELHAKLKETDTPEGVTLSIELHETVERAIAALPEDLRTKLINESGAKALRYFPQGPIKKEYVILPKRMLVDKKFLLALIEKSFEYVILQED